MAHLTVAAVVARLEAAVTGLTGWVAAPLPVGLAVRSARPVAHQSASVMAVRTDVRQGGPNGRRVNAADGAHVDTTIRVEWLWALQVDDFRAAISDGYDGEATLLAALLGVSVANLHLTPLSMTRQVVQGDATHLLGIIELQALHSIPIP